MDSGISLKPHCINNWSGQPLTLECKLGLQKTNLPVRKVPVGAPGHQHFS